MRKEERERVDHGVGDVYRLLLRGGDDPRTAWRCMRVTYYDQSKDRLVAAVAAPTTCWDGLGGTPAYFSRHWSGGPHIRLHFYSTENAFVKRIVPRVAHVAEEFLQRCPSRTVIDPYGWRETQRLLSSVEQMRSAEFRPLQRNNTVSTEETESRAGVLGSERAEALFQAFHAATNSAAVRTVERTLAGSSTLGVGLDLMIVVANAFGGPGVDGVVSYASHATAFLSSQRVSGLERAFESSYQRAAGRLRTRVQTITSAWRRDGLPVHMTELVAALSSLKTLGEELIRSRSLHMAGASSESEALGWSSLQSNLHQTMASAPEYSSHLRSDPSFNSYRLVLNGLYLYLSRVGVTSLQRFQLCYFVARATEEVWGSTVEDAVTRAVQRMRGADE